MEEQPKKNYGFATVLRWLSIVAVPIEPLNMSPFLKIIYSIYCVAFLIVFPLGYIASQILQIQRVKDDMKQVTCVMGYVFSDSLGLVKMTMAFGKRYQLRDMCNVFDSEKMRPNRKRGGDVEFTYIDQANRQVIVQVVCFQVMVMILMTYRTIFFRNQLVEYRALQQNGNASFGDVPLPFVSYIPFEHDSGFRYYLAIIFQHAGTWLFGLYISSVDAILCGFIAHSNAQLLILKNYISRFQEKSEERFMVQSDLSIERKKDIIKRFRADTTGLEKWPSEIQKHAKEIIKEYVIHHIDIYNLCMKLEDEFSMLVMLQFLSSIGMSCVILFQMYNSVPGDSEFMSSVAFMFVVMYQLYRYCICGTNLSDYSVSVSDSIYEMTWMVADTSMQKSFALMMQRAQRPIILTAAKLLFLSLQTYTALSGRHRQYNPLDGFCFSY